MLRSITVFPLVVTRHSGFVYTSLLEFGQIEQVPVMFRTPDRKVLDLQRQGLVVAVCALKNGTELTIGFDIGDWPDIASLSGLDFCDVYIKRSYDAQLISNLPTAYRRKILPLGLYHSCSPQDVLIDFRTHFSACCGAIAENIGAAPQSVITLFRWVARFVFQRRAAFPSVEQFRQLRGRGQYSVFYHTRIWNPKTHKSFAGRTITELNEFRIELVRKLRISLGDQFVGGIIRTTFSEDYCPELLSPHASDLPTYLSLLGNSRIAVTESGLHASTGSRLPEYFAAGRCIVSEPLVYDVPNAPINGVHWHNFDDAESCVEVCLNLLSNTVSIDNLMIDAANYYDKTLQPGRQAQALMQVIQRLSRSPTE